MKPQVIYIAGSGRSGSTLLDIILGNLPGAFSCGELSNIVRLKIKEQEYCSCKKSVGSCSLWSEVYDKWEKARRLSEKDLREIQSKYFTNKSYFKMILAKRKSRELFEDYFSDWILLYEILFSCTKSQILIDCCTAFALSSTASIN